MSEELLNKFIAEQKNLNQAEKQFIKNAINAISRPMDYKSIARKFVVVEKLEEPHE